MRPSKVKIVKNQAEELIRRCRILLDDATDGRLKNDNPYYYCALSASVRRASMDLTRAMADMRKSN